MEIQKNQNNETLESDDLERLRALVLGNDYKQAIEDVAKKGFTQSVSDVVSEALVLRGEKDSSVTETLTPVINSTIKESVEKNPQTIVNIIHPIIGPSIRKAVSTAVLDLLLSINEIVERSVGVNSIKWRFEAWRAGMPYTQYVLLKNIKYRVDQVFLINKSSGVLMSSVSNELYFDEDSDLVSSMLTAINDFVIDSFQISSDGSLERIRFGDRVIQINVGQKTILALAVTGMVTRKLKEKATKTLEEIEREHKNIINAFDGNTESMVTVMPLLESCLLEEKFKKQEKNKKPWIAIIIILLFVSWFGYNWFKESQIKKETNRIIQQISQKPGFIVLDHFHDNEKLNIKLIQDPSVNPPEPQNFETFNLIKPVEFNISYSNILQREVWMTYLNNHYNFLEKPTLNLEKKLLIINGKIKQDEWLKLKQDQNIKNVINKINVLDYQIVIPENKNDIELKLISKLKKEINNTQFFFKSNESELKDEEKNKLVSLSNNISQLQSLLKKRNLSIGQLLVLGYTDGIGNKTTNINLGKKRAEYIANYLIQQGIPEKIIDTYSMTNQANQPLSQEKQRRVDITIVNEDIKAINAISEKPTSSKTIDNKKTKEILSDL